MANEAFEALNLRGIKRELATQLHVGSIELISVIVFPAADVVDICISRRSVTGPQQLSGPSTVPASTG